MAWVWIPDEEGEQPEPHDAHVRLARKVFRDVGFDISAMQWPRSPEALESLKRWNRLPPDYRAPAGWGYHPNEYMAKNWHKYYGEGT